MRLLLAALALSLPALAAAPLPDDALVTDGTNKFQAGDVEGALAAFEKAAKLAPKDPRPHFLRGAVLYQGKKNSADAIVEYRAALALDGKLAAVHNELGALLMEQGKIDDAAAEYKAATAADPKLGEAWMNLGRAEWKRGQLEAALAAQKKAVAILAKDADARVDLSITLRKLKKMSESLAVAREAVSLGAGDAGTHLNLAFALEANEKLDDAQAELVAATRLAPENPTAWTALASIEMKRKKLDAASSALDRAEKIRPSAGIVVERGRILEARGDSAKAIALLTAATEKSPRSLALKLALAETLARGKKCAEAEKILGGLPGVQEDVKQTAGEVKGLCKKTR
jgi:Tfp pilus assembly protein PilF